MDVMMVAVTTPFRRQAAVLKRHWYNCEWKCDRNAGAHAPVETDNREIGRNHKYTSVPSSRYHQAMRCENGATMGTSIDRPM